VTFTFRGVVVRAVSRERSAALGGLRKRQQALWVAAVLLYGVGDAATTAVGMTTPGVAEAGPVAVHLVGGDGVGGLLALKVVLLAGSYGVWSVLRTPGRVAVPLALAFVGAVVSGWNLLVIAA